MQSLAPVIHRKRAIQVGTDLDASAGVAASAGPGAELEEAPVELHGVIVLGGALVLETTDAVEVFPSRSRPPGGGGVRRCVSEAGIVAGEKPVEHALGLRERACLREPQLDDQAILEGAEEPLDPSLRLWGVRADPADAEFLERTPDLGGLGAALELLSECERAAGIAVKDPMAVRVGHTGEPIAADELAEKQEVTLRVLLQTEDPAEDPAGRVIDGGVEDEPGTAVFEPRMVTAVHLDEEAGLRHALSAAAMAGWPTGAGAADPGRAEEPLHGPTRDTQPFAFGQQLGEVVIIHARIAGVREREDAGPDRLGEASGRRPTAIAMGEGAEAVLTEAGKEPAEMPYGEAEELSGDARLHSAVLHLGEEMHAALFLLGQGYRLPDHGSRVTDSLAC